MCGVVNQRNPSCEQYSRTSDHIPVLARAILRREAQSIIRNLIDPVSVKLLKVFSLVCQIRLAFYQLLCAIWSADTAQLRQVSLIEKLCRLETDSGRRCLRERLFMQACNPAIELLACVVIRCLSYSTHTGCSGSASQ